MAQQEGLGRLKEKYFDIMLVGQTGLGKSTTADKLLIANPDKVKYVLPEQLNTRHEGEVRVQLEDISMWLLHEEDEKEDIETHLKALVYARTKPDPHSEVNRLRDPNPQNQILFSTSSCQVFSNDATKVRILDVPGFEDERAYSSAASSSTSSTASSSQLNGVYQTAKGIATYNVGITRNIIRIQSALGMCFRRVVYFLPCRGPLERANAVLRSQLQQLEFAFGRSVFECMVVVATIPKRYSLMDLEFPHDDIDQCERFFQTALRSVLNVGPSEEEPKVPIIFVSLAESCESILGKIQGAKVSQNGLELRFNPSNCANCGVKVGTLGDEKLTCSTLHDPEASMPYEESTCHPAFAFKHSILIAVLPRKFSEAIAHRWPSYKEEYCVSCKQQPGTSGCVMVGDKYKTWWGKVYNVDHTSEVTNPVEEPPCQTNQPDAAIQGGMQTDQSGATVSPAGHPAGLQVPTEEEDRKG